ncbi:hypothetical protein [Aeromonas veronii]|uniref:hypothetical protein n=1 Tax=Aeromonas veronii TaxID=654 RepID=UPI003006913A
MKNHFFKYIIDIKLKINKLSSNPDDVGCLTEIQRDLLGWHLWLEDATRARKNRINNLKRLKRVRGNSKEKSLVIKRAIQITTEQLSKLKDLKLWARHIGNSIPHIFYDKNDLRAYAYSTEHTELKELSGDIHGKEGLDLENQVFEYASSLGVKVLLNDLTSIMRHGDITLMDDSVPFLMELKKSDACVKKAEKQLRNIKAIENYHLTDESQLLRGGKCISKRIASTCDEKTWINELNNNLSVCLEKGFNISKVDEYLYCYSCFSGNLPKGDSFSFLGEMKSPMMVSLNRLKNDLDLSLFYPFSLSIKDPNAFSLFICGHLHIYLFVNWGALVDMVSSYGLNVEVIDQDYCLEIKNKDGGVIYSYTLTKALLEFTSLDWAIEQLCGIYKDTIICQE